MNRLHDVFWGEIAPSDHLVQIYEHDEVFLDCLEGFVAGGLRTGDGVVIIATPPHLEALNERLLALDLDLDKFRSKDQYIDLDAEETLAKFMRGNWPDETLFRWLVADLLGRAGNGRRVRAFGEMVALLWEQGHNGATVRLEHLWHSLCEEEVFSLLCAYPRAGFTKDATVSIREICEAHSRVVTWPLPIGSVVAN